MYRILLVDDEGLELNALKMIVSKEFGEEVIIETAMTGRVAIEVFDAFRPDIIVMDIQMPGINGIDAIKEIRKVHSSGKFLVLTAYDNFEYVQKALNIGVNSYMTKPFNRSTLIDELRKLMLLVDKEKNARREDLMLRERLEAAMPMLEVGFIYAILMGQDWDRITRNYYNLFGYGHTHGYFLVMDFLYDDDPDSSLEFAGMGKRITAIIKELFKDCVTLLMGKRNLTVVFCNEPSDEYKTRLQIINQTTTLAQKLEELTGFNVSIGVGSVVSMDKLSDSYSQAVSAHMENGEGVAHYDDLPIGKHWEEGYPSDVEYAIYNEVESGKHEDALEHSKRFFNWMVTNHASELNDVKLKVLELVMRVEYLMFHTGGRTYHFLERHGYLDEVVAIDNYDALRGWFLGHIKTAMEAMNEIKTEETVSTIDDAKKYIKENFDKNLTLNEVSEIVHISPYYFSKLFKEKTGRNFIEYLTYVRMEYAKTNLRESSLSIKDICLNAGYQDPNYFSRSFKKYAGVTPGEYRDGKNE